MPIEITQGLGPAVADVLTDCYRVLDQRQQRNECQDVPRRELVLMIEHVFTADDHVYNYVYKIYKMKYEMFKFVQNLKT